MFGDWVVTKEWVKAYRPYRYQNNYLKEGCRYVVGTAWEYVYVPLENPINPQNIEQISNANIVRKLN